jgi:hypothetical protein
MWPQIFNQKDRAAAVQEAWLEIPQVTNATSSPEGRDTAVV